VFLSATCTLIMFVKLSAKMWLIEEQILQALVRTRALCTAYDQSLQYLSSICVSRKCFCHILCSVNHKYYHKGVKIAYLVWHCSAISHIFADDVTYVIQAILEMPWSYMNTENNSKQWVTVIFVFQNNLYKNISEKNWVRFFSSFYCKTKFLS